MHLHHSLRNLTTLAHAIHAPVEAVEDSKPAIRWNGYSIQVGAMQPHQLHLFFLGGVAVTCCLLLAARDIYRGSCSKACLRVGYGVMTSVATVAAALLS